VRVNLTLVGFAFRPAAARCRRKDEHELSIDPLDILLVVLLVMGGISLRNLARAYDATHQTETRDCDAGVGPEVCVARAQISPHRKTGRTSRRRTFSVSIERRHFGCATTTSPQNVGPKPILFGTLSLALAIEWRWWLPRQGNTRAFRLWHVGETIDGWKLRQIQENRCG